MQNYMSKNFEMDVINFQQESKMFSRTEYNYMF